LIELPFIDSATTERSKIKEYITITLHLQEFSAVNDKGTTLKGKIPAIGAGLFYYQ